MPVTVSKIDNADKNVRRAKVDKLYADVVNCFKKHKPTVPEILIVLGNLGYTLGASIGGYKDKGPSAEELNQMYATNPTVDVALMVQGLQTCLWVDSLNKTVEDIKKETQGDKIK